MSSYSPVHITGNATGLVQSRPDFLLPNDAYPVLENAFVWRERIKRKQGYQISGRFQRNVPAIGTLNLTQTTTAGTTTIIPDILADAGIALRANQPSASIVPYAVINPQQPALPARRFTINVNAGAAIFLDNGNGTLISGGGNAAGGTINYATGNVVLNFTVAVLAGLTIATSFTYYPSLPVMGLRNRDINNYNNQQTIGFDTVYAYIFNNATVAWQEFIPGTTWTGANNDFFWTTNYWTLDSSLLFWVTNETNTTGDPIRYTDGTTWFNFANPLGQIDAGPNYLTQALCILPFRGRLLMFNTWEGPNQASSINYPQRIRWAAIGDPLLTGSVGPPLTYGAWRDDVRGYGGFLDIPTNELINSVGFVRDNLVIYCSRSTWQLRYTGRSIAPFQIEKVNSELGAEATFSAVQFDTSLVGIGDKGIVQCDSFKSERIDVKIPDLVFSFAEQGSMDANYGTERVYGIRDFVQRLAYWTYPFNAGSDYPLTYPNRRLVYNYENDSWAIFTDSLTCLGTFFPSTGRTWLNTTTPWNECNFPWNEPTIGVPLIIGGNQQGFVEFLDSKTSNDPSLFIQGVTGNGMNPTSIFSPNHNLVTGDIIQISGIIGSPSMNYTDLNGGIFYVETSGDPNNFTLYTFNFLTGQFDLPQLDPVEVYLGGGVVAIRDNFVIQSKRFNFLDEGQSIQIGYIDVLLDSTNSGALSLNLLANYNDDEPVNIPPQNEDASTSLPDTFFNSVVSTTNPNPGNTEGTRYWQRVYCPARGNFLTIVWTLSPAQLAGVEQTQDVQIQAHIVWMRKAGRLTNR